MVVRVAFTAIAFFALTACDGQAQVDEMQFRIKNMDTDWSGTTDEDEFYSVPYNEGPCPLTGMSLCDFNTFDSRDSNPGDGEIQYDSSH